MRSAAAAVAGRTDAIVDAIVVVAVPVVQTIRASTPHGDA